MALDMRALYYIALSAATRELNGKDPDTETVKAVENCLNQNFTLIAQKISNLEERLSAAEDAISTL